MMRHWLRQEIKHKASMFNWLVSKFFLLFLLFFILYLVRNKKYTQAGWTNTIFTFHKATMEDKKKDTLLKFLSILN